MQTIYNKLHQQIFHLQIFHQRLSLLQLPSHRRSQTAREPNDTTTMRASDWVCCKCAYANPKWADACLDTSHHTPHYRSKCGIHLHESEGKCRDPVTLEQRTTAILNRGQSDSYPERDNGTKQDDNTKRDGDTKREEAAESL